MQANVMCSLPRKGKFPDQKLSVLLEVTNLVKRPSPRLELHSLPSQPTGIYCRLIAGIGWLALFLPVDPLLACPAFRLPWHLLSLSRPLPMPLLFPHNQIFGVVFVRAILKKYVEHKLLCWLSTCRSESNGAKI